MKPQTYALMTGAVVGSTGLAGMIPPFRKPNKGYSKIGGVVPTNDLFNFLRLGIGITGILASRKRDSSVVFNRIIAGNYALMAVMGVIPQTKTMFGLLPIFGANVWLHALTAAGSLLTEQDLLAKTKKALPFGTDRTRSIPVSSLKSAQPDGYDSLNSVPM